MATVHHVLIVFTYYADQTSQFASSRPAVHRLWLNLAAGLDMLWQAHVLLAAILVIKLLHVAALHVTSLVAVLVEEH